MVRNEGSTAVSSELISQARPPEAPLLPTLPATLYHPRMCSLYLQERGSGVTAQHHHAGAVLAAVVGVQASPAGRASGLGALHPRGCAS